MPQPEWPPVRVWAGDANMSWQWVQERTRRAPKCQRGTRGGPLCLQGAGLSRPPSKGASLGRDRLIRSHEAGPVGQAGRRTC